MPLSARVRPNSEAAPWVIKEIERQEAAMEKALAALRKTIPALYPAYPQREAITLLEELLK